MPMSSSAYTGLKAVVAWNPSIAEFLFYLLKDTPYLVKYKDDFYGPLTLLLIEDVIRKPVFHNMIASIKRRAIPISNAVSVLVRLPPFPEERLADCKVFGDEWKQRKFTKEELANALEQILFELP